MFLVFLVKSTLTIYGISITKLKILITSSFAITNYKMQKVTFWLAILDLYKNSKLEDKDLYQRFYSIYVQLSRLQILNGVQLLQTITLDDI